MTTIVMLTRLVEDAKVKAIHTYRLYVYLCDIQYVMFVHVVLIICLANNIFSWLPFMAF